MYTNTKYSPEAERRAEQSVFRETIHQNGAGLSTAPVRKHFGSLFLHFFSMEQERSEDHSVCLQLLPCLEQACICGDKHGKQELTCLRDLALWLCPFQKPCGPCFGCCLLQFPIHHPRFSPCSPLPKVSWGFSSPHCLQDWPLQAKPPVEVLSQPTAALWEQRSKSSMVSGCPSHTAVKFGKGENIPSAHIPEQLSFLSACGSSLPFLSLSSPL